MAGESEILMKLLSGGAQAASGLNPVTAAISAVPELFKLGTAIKEGIQAGQIRKQSKRPTMEVPKGVTEAIANMRMRAMNGQLPGQGLMENKLGANTAQGARNIQETGGGSAAKLAALASMYNGQNNAINDLNIQAANNQQNNQNIFNSGLQSLGQWQNQVWDYNKKQKYDAEQAKAAELGTASTNNAFGALKGLGASAASTIGNNQGTVNKSATGLGLTGAVNTPTPPPIVSPNISSLPTGQQLAMSNLNSNIDQASNPQVQMINPDNSYLNNPAVNSILNPNKTDSSSSSVPRLMQLIQRLKLSNSGL